MINTRILLLGLALVLGCAGWACATDFGRQETGDTEMVSILDKYSEIKKGDWVKLERSDDTDNIILVADKDGDKVTIEIREWAGKKGQKRFVSWEQVVIDTKEHEVVLVRTKNPVTNEVTEREPQPGEEIDDVVQAEFKKVREEKITQEVAEKDEESGEYVSRRKQFMCTVYEGVVFGDRYIEIWYADDIPLYPVKANLPGLSTTIKLVRHGKDLESRF